MVANSRILYSLNKQEISENTVKKILPVRLM